MDCMAGGPPRGEGHSPQHPSESAQVRPLPSKLSPVPEEEVVPCAKVSQVTKITSVKPPDLGNKVTPNNWKPDFCLLTGGQTRPFSLPPIDSPLFN